MIIYLNNYYVLFSFHSNAYKANVLLRLLSYSSFVTQNYLQHSIDITTEQSFRYRELDYSKNLNIQKCIIVLGFCESYHNC